VPSAAQTPMVLVQGGEATWLDKACERALIRAGYDPTAFGSYAHVKGKIDAAKDKCDKWDAMSPSEKRSSTPPTDADRFLSQCQSGHITQDAVFRKPGGRNSPCDNHPGAAGNVTGLAPCMPHFGMSNRVGSTHQRITINEPGAAATSGKPGEVLPAGTPMSPKMVQNAAGQTIDIALKGARPNGPTADAGPLLDKAEKLKDQRGTLSGARADDLKERERGTRQAGSTAAQQASAASLQETARVDGKKVTAPADGRPRDAAEEKAKECIEAFRKAGLDDMRKQVVKENSTANKQAAKSKAEKAAKGAADKKAAAEKRQKDADKLAAKKQAEADKARADLKDADTPEKKAKLRQQRDEAEAAAKAAGQDSRAAAKDAREHGREQEKAEKDLKEATRFAGPPPPPDQRTADEVCLQDQADALEPAAKRGRLPQMTGKVPPRATPASTDDTGDGVSGSEV
jgi:hypothetical protein